jgi:hypothetical protein
MVVTQFRQADLIRVQYFDHQIVTLPVRVAKIFVKVGLECRGPRVSLLQAGHDVGGRWAQVLDATVNIGMEGENIWVV